MVISFLKKKNSYNLISELITFWAVAEVGGDDDVGEVPLFLAFKRETKLEKEMRRGGLACDPENARVTRKRRGKLEEIVAMVSGGCVEVK